MCDTNRRANQYCSTSFESLKQWILSQRHEIVNPRQNGKNNTKSGAQTPKQHEQRFQFHHKNWFVPIR